MFWRADGACWLTWHSAQLHRIGSHESSPHELFREAYAWMTLWGLRSWLLRWLCFGCRWNSIWRSKGVLRRLLVHCISHAFRNCHLLCVVVRIFPFIFQSLFQSIDAFQQCFEHVGFRASFLGNRICARGESVSMDCCKRKGPVLTIDAVTVEDLAGLTRRSQTVTLDLCRV